MILNAVLTKFLLYIYAFILTNELKKFVFAVLNDRYWNVLYEKKYIYENSFQNFSSCSKIPCPSGVAVMTNLHKTK